jgi:Bacterial Ig domain
VARDQPPIGGKAARGEGLTNGQSNTLNYTLNTATLPVGSHFARIHIQTLPLAEATSPRSRDFDINITVNGLPMAVNDTVAAAEDTPVSGTLAGNDTSSGDGGNRWALATAPANGTLTVTVNPDDTFTYTPNANFNGTDRFSYTITDADGDVSTATVTVNVAERADITGNRRAGILSRRFVGKRFPPYNYLNSDFSNTLRHGSESSCQGELSSPRLASSRGGLTLRSHLICPSACLLRAEAQRLLQLIERLESIVLFTPPFIRGSAYNPLQCLGLGDTPMPRQFFECSNGLRVQQVGGLNGRYGHTV